MAYIAVGGLLNVTQMVATARPTMLRLSSPESIRPSSPASCIRYLRACARVVACTPREQGTFLLRCMHRGVGPSRLGTYQCSPIPPLRLPPFPHTSPISRALLPASGFLLWLSEVVLPVSVNSVWEPGGDERVAWGTLLLDRWSMVASSDGFRYLLLGRHAFWDAKRPR